jgi:hypothetical protein
VVALSTIEVPNRSSRPTPAYVEPEIEPRGSISKCFEVGFALSEIGGCQPRCLANPSEHAGTDFVLVVEGEHVVGPARKEPALPWKRARRSRGSEEQASQLGNRFTVLEAIGKHTLGQRFDLCERFVARFGVDHHAGKDRYLRDPAAILFALQFYCESLFRHGASMPLDEVVANSVHSTNFGHRLAERGTASLIDGAAAVGGPHELEPIGQSRCT